MDKKKKILIIEDEKALLAAIRSKLSIKGYDVITAEDGEEGLNFIKKEKPDLVLLDIMLPKMDGFQVLENLKKDGDKTSVIVISNSGQPVEINRAVELGVKDYLIKADFRPNDVLEKVEAAIGPGTLSDVPIPASEVENEGGDDANAAEPTGAEVLLVEDDEFLRTLVAQKLTQEGFKVKAAIDGNEAFGIIKEKLPNIILLDLILPGMDGFEILDLLKKNPETSAIPVIVLSNLGQREDVDRATAAGAEAYLIKANFTPGEIVQKIRSILKKKYV